MAPEIINDEPYSEGADIFSFGIILFEMVTGKRPFHESSGGSNLAATMKLANKERPKIPPECKCPKWLSEMIQQCWDAEPTRRPTAAGILERLRHPAVDDAPETAADSEDLEKTIPLPRKSN